MPARSSFRLQVRLQPRARHTRIAGREGDALKVQVNAPPVGGAANAALIALLAKTFHVPRRAVRLVRGDRSRLKLIDVETAEPEACRRRLASVIEGAAPPSATTKVKPGATR